MNSNDIMPEWVSKYLEQHPTGSLFDMPEHIRNWMFVNVDGAKEAYDNVMRKNEENKK